MITLDIAQKLIAEALASARRRGLKPMGVVALDSRAAIVSLSIEDGNPIGRWKIAHGKAQGALAMGMSSRALAGLQDKYPAFLAALPSVFPEGVLPVPGAVLIRDSEGAVLGALSASGDSGDNDEAIVIDALQALGFAV